MEGRRPRPDSSPHLSNTLPIPPLPAPRLLPLPLLPQLGLPPVPLPPPNQSRRRHHPSSPPPELGALPFPQKGRQVRPPGDVMALQVPVPAAAAAATRRRG